MIFNSYIFIFVFLPLVVSGWFFLNKKSEKYAKVFLVVMSLIFLAYGNLKSLFVMLMSGVFNYLISNLYSKVKNKKALMIMAVAIDILVLFIFKYFNFFADSINDNFGMDIPLLSVFLPLGISFYTFRQIMFIVDRYHNEIKHYSILDYFCYLCYFPLIAQGPIASFEYMEKSFSDNKKIDYENVTKGLLLFILGLTKKALLADTLGLFVNSGYNHGNLDTLMTIAVSLAYTFQIYFDFSGYCDMAMGIGRMMNIDIPVNFNNPYKADTVRDFWKRWHITLNQFFTKYLYFPMGGSRKGKIRTVINTLIVFLLSGLWHGANYTFILWGLVHGIGVILSPKNVTGKWKYILRPFTFIYVNLAWILFKSKDIEQAFEMYKNIFVPFTNNSVHQVSRAFDIALIQVPVIFLKKVFPECESYIYIVFMCLVLVLAFVLCMCKNAYQIIEGYTLKSKGIIIYIFAILLVLDVLTLSDTASFLYTNF